VADALTPPPCTGEKSRGSEGRQVGGGLLCSLSLVLVLRCPQALAVRAEDTEALCLEPQEAVADAIDRARKLPAQFCELPER